MEAEERTMSDQAQRTVLVVEDEEALAVGLRDALLHGGFEATVVGDGVQGLEAVRTQQPDLLVLDLMLPGMSGLDVLKALRAEGFRTRVLIVTALADEEDLLRGFQAGADDYLTKPFSPRELLARVEPLHDAHPELGHLVPPAESARPRAWRCDTRHVAHRSGLGMFIFCPGANMRVH